MSDSNNPPAAANDSATNDAGRRRVEEFLAAVDASLAESGVATEQRQNVTDDLRVQIDEMLAQSGATIESPTSEQVQAVLAELDPPESYAGAADENEAEQSAAGGPSAPAGAQPHEQPVGAAAGAGTESHCGPKPGWFGGPRQGRCGPPFGSRGGNPGGQWPRWWAWKWRQRRNVARAIWQAVDQFGPMAHPLFARFTERARNVIAAAKAEARRLNHDYIGTEHLLLGVLAERTGVAATTLAGMGFDLSAGRTALDIYAQAAPAPSAAAPLLPLTPKARRALGIAKFSTRGPVEPEHILLGVMEIPDGLAVLLLLQAGLNIDAIRDQIVRQARTESAAPSPAAAPASTIFWPAGTGRTWSLPGQTWKLIAGADDTGGSHASFDVAFAAEYSGAPATMDRFDLSIYLLEGALRVRAGDRTLDVQPGSFVRIPRGTSHSIAATAASRAVLTTTPAGVEKWIAELAAAPDQEPAAIAAIAERHGVRIG